MTPSDSGSIRTRASLLQRLKKGEDIGWQEFYRTYGKLVRDFAVQAGLTDTEADEVVQDTTIAMAQHLTAYTYDPKVCRFKTWLLNQASWRVKDQLRKRKKEPSWAAHPTAAAQAGADTRTRTATVAQVPDLAAVDMDALFETEWRRSLLSNAFERVKNRFNLRQLQIFDLLVQKEWTAAEVARSLRVSMANVYVIRHRISAAIRAESKRLERELEQMERVQVPRLQKGTN